MSPPIPRFITYVSDRNGGDWKLHKTIGHVRICLRNNGYGKTNPSWWNERQIKLHEDWESTWRIYEISQTGTWSEVDIKDVFRKDIW